MCGRVCVYEGGVLAHCDSYRAHKDVTLYSEVYSAMEFLLRHCRGGGPALGAAGPLGVVKSFITTSRESAVVEVSGPRGVGHPNTAR